MKASSGLLAGALLAALSACDGTAPTTGGVAEPDSAASAGPSYCETVPSDPDEMNRWNELCSPADSR
jgi:hypothetical protein